jgi:hypothetical protein
LNPEISNMVHTLAPVMPFSQEVMEHVSPSMQQCMSGVCCSSRGFRCGKKLDLQRIGAKMQRSSSMFLHPGGCQRGSVLVKNRSVMLEIDQWEHG